MSDVITHCTRVYCLVLLRFLKAVVCCWDSETGDDLVLKVK